MELFWALKGTSVCHAYFILATFYSKSLCIVLVESEVLLAELKKFRRTKKADFISPVETSSFVNTNKWLSYIVISIRCHLASFHWPLDVISKAKFMP